jgi:hypothetical protein
MLDEPPNVWASIFIYRADQKFRGELGTPIEQGRLSGGLAFQESIIRVPGF